MGGGVIDWSWMELEVVQYVLQMVCLELVMGNKRNSMNVMVAMRTTADEVWHTNLFEYCE